MLVAYVDDELDPAQRADVEEAIRADPEAQAIVSVLKNSAAAVKTAFDEPIAAPVPRRLLDVLQADAGRSGGSPSSDVVVPFARRRPVSVVSRYLLPLAASLAALAIGFGAGVGYDSGSGPIVPAGMTSPYDSALMQALEHGDPGVALDYRDAAAGVQGSVVIIGQVATSFNGTCREFKHTIEGAGAVLEYGLACRGTDNAWQVLTVSAGQPS
jgi:anti-sigma factor RsiW